MYFIVTGLVLLACATNGHAITRHLLQGGGGGNNIWLNNCSSSCNISACEGDGDCSTYWDDNEDNRYGNVDVFINDYESYCNDSSNGVDCDSGVLNTFVMCLEESDCWDCNYWSSLELAITIYDASGSVTTDSICEVDWRSYLTDIMGPDITGIQANSQQCSSGGSGSGGGGSGRRLLQPPPGGEGGEGGEGGGEGGEGSGQGGSGCGEATYDVC